MWPLYQKCEPILHFYLNVYYLFFLSFFSISSPSCLFLLPSSLFILQYILALVSLFLFLFNISYPFFRIFLPLLLSLPVFSISFPLLLFLFFFIIFVFHTNKIRLMVSLCKKNPISREWMKNLSHHSSSHGFLFPSSSSPFLPPESVAFRISRVSSMLGEGETGEDGRERRKGHVFCAVKKQELI